MKKSERLRQQKGKAVERMTELNNLAKAQGRDLTPDEQKEYDAKKTEAESLTGQIEAAVAEENAPIQGTSLRAEPKVDAEKLVADALKADHARVAEIHVLAVTHKIPAEVLNKFLAEGATVQAVKDHCLELAAKRSEENPINHHRAEVTRDERLTRRTMIETALLHRYSPDKHKLDDGAREYRGMNLMRIAEECLSMAGVRTRGMAPMELAAAALESRGSGTFVGDDIERMSAMGTSDFPYILANVANKTLRSAYAAEIQTWRPFCRQSSASDFKAKYINQLGDAPNLEKVGENGEFHTGSIPEARESYRLETYGKILPLTRQSIINDDLGAFTRLPELQGRAASRKESDIIWALITGNPTMGDGYALFDNTNHGNYVTSSGTAISVDSLGILKQKMRIQKGLGGTENLNLVPRFLLVPTTKEQIAVQYTMMPIIPATAATSNPWVGTLTPIVEPRLDAASTTAWYMVASPDQIDTIEYAYLAGQAGAYLETKVGFEVDGIQLKCRLDFGGAAIDWRAFAKNDGA